MTHSFQFDPCSILGVTSNASLSEIRDAYRQKSLKHHPDKGGDEWAFRMVARAYEILSTARVVDRAANEARATPRRPQPAPSKPTTPPPPPTPPPRTKTTWTNGFGPGAAHPDATATAAASASAFVAGFATPGVDPPSATNLSGWSGASRSHTGEKSEVLVNVVAAELLILRFELECSVDLFTRSAENRNLSCSLHLTWPLPDLTERAETLPGAAKILKRIGEAFKARGVRKHATTKRAEVEESHFDAWLTYPTAVMASEALEAFREALVEHGLEVEKQVREIAIPRNWK